VEGEVCGYTGDALAVFGSTSTATEVIATISPITTYGSTTNAAEIVANVDLHGRRVVVTGASSGIGVETLGRWHQRAPR
jgi:hypothetical protein